MAKKRRKGEMDVRTEIDDGVDSRVRKRKGWRKRGQEKNMEEQREKIKGKGRLWRDGEKDGGMKENEKEGIVS